MKTKGFTSIELVFVLILITGFALISISSSSQLRDNNEKQALIDNIRSIVQYARLQAVSRGHIVYLAPLDPDFNWSKGVVLTRFNKKVAEDEVLHQWQWNYRHWTIKWAGVRSTHKIAFSPDTAHGISNGTFTLTNTRTLEKIKIIVNRLGRVRINDMMMESF
ncbi:Tfp type 4 fimbrial pilin related signal peptide protein domain protein [Legionella moravica]|uniref:Type II secretion system protein H n=1 Tax=Legionella moravica TaxID=39962 RepID=A0A378JXW8_9GAMM|nr:GspH/FimT family protein [Legionella moravica]KTD34244.1 Tfp type 4 fimbrial pilin related signal peptide protein domain protein [Legionella moravica]STX62880.1 Tfp type 4 fimbrial pilin related signal peptide protein domain [Legionella moravica]